MSLAINHWFNDVRFKLTDELIMSNIEYEVQLKSQNMFYIVQVETTISLTGSSYQQAQLVVHINLLCCSKIMTLISFNWFIISIQDLCHYWQKQPILMWWLYTVFLYDVILLTYHFFDSDVIIICGVAVLCECILWHGYQALSFHIKLYQTFAEVYNRYHFMYVPLRKKLPPQTKEKPPTKLSSDNFVCQNQNS